MPILRDALLTALLLVGSSASATPADLVLRGGKVYTVDGEDRVAEALAIRTGKIVYVGPSAGLAAHLGPRTQIVELGGRVAMPGLIDAHMHPAEAGAQSLSCDLDYASLTVAALQARVQACLDEDERKHPGTTRWLSVVNWFQQGTQPEGVPVTRATLDVLKTQRPILMTSSFGHSSVVNTRALQLAHIEDGTADPQAGKIVRDAAGHATGLLEDRAQDLVRQLLPDLTPAENLAAARASLAPMRKQGITSFLEAASSPEVIAAYADLEKKGELTARAYFAPVLKPTEASDPSRVVARLRALRKKYDQGPLVARPRLTVRNVKLFMDGVITAPAFTSPLLAPYLMNAGTAAQPRWVPGPHRGPPTYYPPAVLRPLLSALAEAGFEPHLHADGEVAVRESLDAIEALRARFTPGKLRCTIAHAELVDPADYPRFAALDAVPVLSFQWAKPAADTIEGARDFLGPTRHARIEPEGFLARAGARIAYGSDWPVDPLDEWLALQIGVTRRARSTEPRYAGRLGDDPGLSRAAVLRAITMGSAYALHEDTQLGSLEVGKWGDVIVLDGDVLTLPEDQIATVKVRTTIVGGRVVYDAPTP